MKNLLTIAMCLFCTGIFAQSLPVQFNVPSSLYAEQQCKPENNIAYTVSDLRSDCVNIYGNNPGETAVNLRDGKTNMKNGTPAFVFSTVQLYSVSGTSDQKVYSFGMECAEEDLDDANVSINYLNQASSQQLPVGTFKSANLSLDNRNILTISNNETPNGFTDNQTYLKVLANENSTATISINNDSRQGQVFVCIYSAANGNCIGKLHAKSSDLSFTTDQDVYVVPMIAPNSFSERQSTTILFEVGDPRRNAKVVAEEEGE